MRSPRGGKRSNVPYGRSDSLSRRQTEDVTLLLSKSSDHQVTLPRGDMEAYPLERIERQPRKSFAIKCYRAEPLNAVTSLIGFSPPDFTPKGDIPNRRSKSIIPGIECR